MVFDERPSPARVSAAAAAKLPRAALLALIVAYIVLGILALRPSRGPGARIALYLAALLVYAQVYGIARAHHPLGWLWLWG